MIFATVAATTAETEIVCRRELAYQRRIRTTAFAEKAETISNPLDHSQIKFLVPDGAYVEKGQLITEFDAEDAMRRLRDHELEKKIIEADLEKRTTEIRNKQMGLDDELGNLLDQKAVLATKVARYRAMPDPDEVRVAEGRLRVARLEAVAAQEDHNKATSRFERGTISPAKLDAYAFAQRRKEALLLHAQDNLAYARTPTSTNTIRKLELQIENVDMEIGKLRHEIEENEKISEIQRKGAMARKEIIDTRIRELTDDVKNLRLYAPIAGHVIHLREFKNWFLKSGEKMFKNFNFMRIPDPSTIAFKGSIAEADRKFFDIGDRAVLHVSGAGGDDEAGAVTEITGRITSISRIARDRGEKEEEDWGGSAKFGVMVHDVIVTPDERPDWLRIGTHATCELVSERKVTGPSVPATAVKMRGDDVFMSIDGTYRKVDGQFVAGYFVLNDARLIGTEVSLYGEFPEDRVKGEERAEGEEMRRFRASGEMMPANTDQVTVKRIYRWGKVAWLIDEDTEVKAGDVVARLDPKEAGDDLRQWQSRLKEAESSRQSQEEECALQEREGTFKLARERNLVEIARLDRNTEVYGRDWPGIFNAELDLRRAEIDLEDLTRQLERRSKNTASVSPQELARLQRDVHRQELKRERARIRLDQLSRGLTDVAAAQAELDYAEAQLKLKTLEKQVETDNFRVTRRLAHARRNEMHRRKNVRTAGGVDGEPDAQSAS